MKIPKSVLQGCSDIRVECPKCGEIRYVTGSQKIDRHKVGFRYVCEGSSSPVSDADVVAWLRERAESARRFAEESRKRAANLTESAQFSDERAARIEAFLTKVTPRETGT